MVRYERSFTASGIRVTTRSSRSISKSVPGFYVTGNLYRPKAVAGKRPAVLSPHGHFPGGRFQDEGRDEVHRKIVQGAERFEDGGRSFMQSRCVQLARMGCVVFHYDMIGYGDSVQIPLDVAHRFSRSRVGFKRPSEYGLYSAEALLRQHNSLGLHTFNSIRALDFLTDLPDVDVTRVAVTGGSGGGTQTFMLCAVDDRPLVSVPVVIVSTTRQGGCTCENVCGFRLGTYNLEMTALHAPKPLLLISADDATRTMSLRGFPILQRHYGLLGAKDRLAHASFLQFPHNYNHVSRTAMYHWLNRHLRLGLTEPIVERPYQRLTERELTVWSNGHRRPATDAKFQERLFAWFDADAQSQLAKITPRDRSTMDSYRETVGAAWDVLLRRLSPEADVRFDRISSASREGYQLVSGLLRYRSIEDDQVALPLLQLVPSRSSGRTVLWLDDAGKRGLYSSEGTLHPAVERLLDGGVTVVGVDLFYQGEFLETGTGERRRARWLDGEEGFGGWTYCYNLPVFAQRVHDVLAVATWLSSDSSLSLMSLSATRPWGAAAFAQARQLFDRVAIDTHGFRFADVRDIYDVDFLPGALKYGDLPGLLALGAPGALWLAGESQEAADSIRAAYAACDAERRLTVHSEPRPLAANTYHAAAVTWILEE